MNALASPADTRLQVNRGLALGLLGIVIFSATLPLTRLAVGSVDAPQLSPWFVTFGRAAVAGGLSVLYLMAHRAAGDKLRPTGRQWGLLAFTALGVVAGFPLFLALALRVVPSTHAAVVTGLLPLATAVVRRCGSGNSQAGPSGPAHCWVPPWCCRSCCCARSTPPANSASISPTCFCCWQWPAPRSATSAARA